jgi:SAM-dependent methyltransferase
MISEKRHQLVSIENTYGKSMYHYVGLELELFKYANQWKKYLSKNMLGYITGDVLEVGSGIGSTTRFLINKSVRSWICLEPDDNLLQISKKNLQPESFSSKIQYINNDIGIFKKKDKFDTIIYIDVLEHIKYSDVEISKACHLLRDKGTLILILPAHQFLFSEFDSHVGHYRRYNLNDVERIIPSHYEIIKYKYLDSFSLVLSLSNKLFLKRSLPTKIQIKIWNLIFIRISKFLDSILRYRVGKSLFVVIGKKLD